MPVHFAPDIPLQKLRNALDAFHDVEAVLGYGSVILVVEASGGVWCFATPDAMFFSPDTILKKEDIRDVIVKSATGIEFLSKRRDDWTIPHDAFERASETQAAWRLLRKAFVKGEEVPSQPIQTRSVLEILDFDPVSNSYWIRLTVGNGKSGIPFEWFANYPFEEQEICRHFSVVDVEIVGDPALVKRFISEPQMLSELAPLHCHRCSSQG